MCSFSVAMEIRMDLGLLDILNFLFPAAIIRWQHQHYLRAGPKKISAEKYWKILLLLLGFDISENIGVSRVKKNVRVFCTIEVRARK